MQFEFSPKSLDKISTDILLVFAFSGENSKEKYVPLKSFIYLDKVFINALSNAAKISGFSGKRSEMLNYYPSKNSLAKWIIVIGLGKKSEFEADDLRRAMGNMIAKIKDKVDSITLSIPADELGIEASYCSQLIVEGLMLGRYEFGKYKSKKDKSHSISAIIFSQKGDVAEFKKGAGMGKLYAQATILARDLVNEQAAVATPSYLADLAVSIAKKDPKKISCKIFDKKQAEELGMNAFLGIARASDTPPKFIFLEYLPEKLNKKEKLAIVGKGITFDSGGINVKPGDHMEDMKMDMSGAAIVLAVFSVISHMKPNFPVIGLIAATSNMISGSSLVPGDIVTAMNGKTIEVLNTDAEGRVTLADSLSFAVKQKATQIIDFATLTGACMVALGTEISGLFSNNKNLALQIKKAADLAGEKVWEMPLEKEYKTMNKSEIADIANIPNSRYGGTITAALFLEEFIDKTPWVHLDIAGPAFTSKPNDIGPKGGTGHGVRTVLNFLK